MKDTRRVSKMQRGRGKMTNEHMTWSDALLPTGSVDEDYVSSNGEAYRSQKYNIINIHTYIYVYICK